MSSDQFPVVLFDGECNLCNGFVNFLLKRDRGATLRFASLQSDAARRLLDDRLGANPIDADTVVLVQGDRIILRSDAAIAIAALLPWPWKAAVVTRFVPRPIRDTVYRWIARNRKRIFRKKVTCRLPTADERRRFL